MSERRQMIWPPKKKHWRCNWDASLSWPKAWMSVLLLMRCLFFACVVEVHYLTRKVFFLILTLSLYINKYFLCEEDSYWAGTVYRRGCSSSCNADYCRFDRNVRSLAPPSRLTRLEYFMGEVYNRIWPTVSSQWRATLNAPITITSLALADYYFVFFFLRPDTALFYIIIFI